MAAAAARAARAEDSLSGRAAEFARIDGYRSDEDGTTDNALSTALESYEGENDQAADEDPEIVAHRAAMAREGAREAVAGVVMGARAGGKGGASVGELEGSSGIRFKKRRRNAVTPQEVGALLGPAKVGKVGDGSAVSGGGGAKATTLCEYSDSD